MTEAEFVEHWENPNNKRVMNWASKDYRKLISKDEMKSCQMIALWKALKYNRKKYSFYTILNKKTKWEILKAVDFIYKDSEFHEAVDHENLPDEPKANSIDEQEYLSSLPNDLNIVIKQRFYYNMTYKEIGEKNGYSYETARIKINKALNLLKNMH